MSTSSSFALTANGSSLPWSGIPEWTAAELVRRTGVELGRGARLCAWFGVPDAAGVRLVSLIAFDADSALGVARSAPCSGSYPCLTASHPQAHLFEREVWEQCGLTPQGHPWLKPVRRTSGPGEGRGAGAAPADGPFFRVEGPEVHEVGVGPVHAGVIEPGHFRFQCAGEEVLHLEIALGYQHRGVERALVGGPHRATLAQIEAASGDATIAHATAHAWVAEALAGTEPSLRSQWIRAIALELERLANHTGDLGALANDVAFLPTASACGRIRGDFLNLTALVCGNRFGRGLARPGGVRHDLEAGRLERMRERLEAALADVQRAGTWLWDAAAARGRFENTGTLFAQQAVDLGLVGPAARACGLVRDARADHPAGWHRIAQVPVCTWPSGDVLARARVRWLEIGASGRFLREQLAAPPDDAEVLADPPAPAPDALAVALVEGWRGEVCHAALTGPDGRFLRYKIVDPSFHNWFGLAVALRGQAISDFPICNKSFNLSYCGHDL